MLIDTSVARSGAICVDDTVAVVGLIGTGCTRSVFANASAGWIVLARTEKGMLVSALLAVVDLAGIGSTLAWVTPDIHWESYLSNSVELNTRQRTW